MCYNLRHGPGERAAGRRAALSGYSHRNRKGADTVPAAKYEAIYEQMRRAVESGEYQKLLPSENALVQAFGCSRSTIRRAEARLEEEGYVQSVHGKGVVILHRNREQARFILGGIESMREAAERNRLLLRTKVIYFTELVTDGELSALTGFPEGSELYCIRRVRYLDGEALILDHNWFLKRVVRGLSPTIAERSVYDYLENTLGEAIVTTQRKYTVEPAANLDSEYMDLKGLNCLAVVTSRTYNRDGVQFEFTQSRHRPDRFVFYGQAKRTRKP